jgi:enoyl-CoA hydratase/carnithine racemase
MSTNDVGVVRLERADNGIWLLGLVIPDRRNALTGPMSEQLEQAVHAVTSHGDASAIVLHSEGPDFCSGADLALLRDWAARARSGADVAPLLVAFYRRFCSLLTGDLPVVAAVQGRAVGAGAAVPLLCDAVVVS